MNELIHVMALPLLACFILVGIHAYLGFHVIERQVIFVDLALAQISILGACFALILGHHLDSVQSYWLSLGFAILGAAIFSMTRLKKQIIPQEAIIGITYAVSAALLVIILSRCGDGDEHIKQALVGNILLVSLPEVVRIFVVYSIVGVLHFLFRHQFLAISRNPTEAFERGIKVRFWDFIFYVLFGLVVTSSVKIAGVLLVFSLLVVPSVCAMMFSNRLHIRLILGWIIGFVACLMGILSSYYWDFPTGASIVCSFGVILILLSIIRKIISFR